MFGKRETAEEVTMTTASQSIETIIGEGAEFEGTITTKTALRVDGRVKGDIQSTGSVIIGAAGEVVGKIFAKQMFIAGTVVGNVSAEDRTEFVSGGYLHGDLITGDLIIEKGASLDGNCKTKNNDRVKAAETKQPQRPDAQKAE